MAVSRLFQDYIQHFQLPFLDTHMQHVEVLFTHLAFTICKFLRIWAETMIDFPNRRHSPQLPLFTIVSVYLPLLVMKIEKTTVNNLTMKGSSCDLSPLSLLVICCSLLKISSVIPQESLSTSLISRHAVTYNCVSAISCWFYLLPITGNLFSLIGKHPISPLSSC